MVKLEELKPGTSLVGLEPSLVATLAAVVPIAEGVVQIFFRTPDGTPEERLLSRSDEASITVATADELTYYLPPGWDPVIERDIDGDRAETTELESRETRFGQRQAARRVARTLFLGSAPSSVATKPGIRGLDRGRVSLGCLQPGQTASVYSGAINRLVDRLHDLNSSGDKAQDSTRYWFDTRANLRREMEDRKRRFDDKTDVRRTIQETLDRLIGGGMLFDGVHPFTPHGDIADDSGLRLVILPPENWYSREEARLAEELVLEMVRNHGKTPRYRGNRLLFLAADHGALTRLRDAARVVLAWGSIVDDVENGRLNIDLLQQRQANKEWETARSVLPRVARECYKWLLCPTQNSPTDPKPSVEAFPLNTTGKSIGAELECVCVENELVITTWSPVHLRDRLRELYWKGGKTVTGAMAFWEDTLRYLYLPRLKGRDVLAHAIRGGAASRDYFGTAYGQTGETFEGFQFGDPNVSLNDTLLLIEPEAARAYEEAHRPDKTESGLVTPTPTPLGGGSPTPTPPECVTPTPTPTPPRSRSYHGTADVPAHAAKMGLVQLVDEVISLLCSDPHAAVKVTLEISAEFPDGAPDQIKRAVSENANSLGFKISSWD